MKSAWRSDVGKTGRRREIEKTPEYKAFGERV
jgi:hypothetical protein